MKFQSIDFRALGWSHCHCRPSPPVIRIAGIGIEPGWGFIGERNFDGAELGRNRLIGRWSSDDQRQADNLPSLQ